MAQLVLLGKTRGVKSGWLSEGYDRSWLGAIAVLVKPSSGSGKGITQRREISQSLPGYVPLRALGFSCLLHALALTGLIQIPFWAYFSDREQVQIQQTTYRLEKIELSRYLPPLLAKGPGGKPGKGSNPDKQPAKGSTARHPGITLVSNPKLPDNNRQTIMQANSPPDLKIPFELRLPNVIAGPELPSPKQPRRSVPIAPVAPRAAAKAESRAIAPPAIAEKHPEFALDLPPTETLPKLAVPRAIQVNALRASDGRRTLTRTAEAAQDLQAGGGLLSISVDPGPASDLISLPPGNRFGRFSLSPDGGNPGSPGGIAGGDPKGGAGAGNDAGDGSSGVGSGAGGGGGAGEGEGAISLSGNGEANALLLEGAIKPSSIFPVLTPFRTRKNALTVSTGPTGGGGLRIYGVLRGGRIYTVYFPMPERSWVMQYCVGESGGGRYSGNSPQVVARMDHGVIPPDAIEKFDFHRPPVPAEKINEMIILHGKLSEEGIPQELAVLQGVQADVDLLALATFRKWRFKTALRGGKAVAVEFLVGIPVSTNAAPNMR